LIKLFIISVGNKLTIPINLKSPLVLVTQVSSSRPVQNIRNILQIACRRTAAPLQKQACSFLFQTTKIMHKRPEHLDHLGPLSERYTTKSTWTRNLYTQPFRWATIKWQPLIGDCFQPWPKEWCPSAKQQNHFYFYFYKKQQNHFVSIIPLHVNNTWFLK
jgi:hypothetical protein